MRKSVLIPLFLIILVSGCTQSCPENCDKGSCYVGSCSEETGYECVYEVVHDCCGNQLCELGNNETHASCPSDCQSCDDNNMCTVDYYDYTTGECVNTRGNYPKIVSMSEFNEELSNWSDYFNTGVGTVSNAGFLIQYAPSGESTSPAVFFNNEINAFQGGYSMNGSFMIEDGVLMLITRAEGFSSGYALFLNTNSIILTRMRSNQTQPDVLSMKSSSVNKNIWFDYKLVNYEDRLIFEIEDEVIINTTDSNALTNGDWGIGAHYQLGNAEYDEVKVMFDNVTVSEVNSTNYPCQ